MADTADKTSINDLTIPDRDRLFREWILPHVTLSSEHESFLRDHLRLKDTSCYFTHPGTLRIPLEERAPIDQLAALPCCVLRGTSVSLAGPRDGGLLLPMCDPKGHYTAFQVLSNRQIEALQADRKAGSARWWQAAGTDKPMLPNGELPLHVARADGELVVLLQTLAGADIIASLWGKSAISTTEDQFSLETLNRYLTELQPKRVGFLLGRNPPPSVCQRTWEACTRLQESGWTIHIIVPVLTDEEMPERFGSCTELGLESWLEGLPESVQNQIFGRDGSEQLSDYLRRQNRERHLTATAKIRVAYDQLKDVEDDLTINSLALAAGVAWSTVHTWLDEQGISDTAKLRSSIEQGWEPPENEPLPPLVTSDADTAETDTGDVDEDHSLPLFEFAEQEERREREGTYQGTEVITAEMMGPGALDDTEVVIPPEDAPPEEPDADAAPDDQDTPEDEIEVEALPADPQVDESEATPIDDEPAPEPEQPEKPKTKTGASGTAAPAAESDKQISLRPAAIIAFIIIFLVLVWFIAKAWGPNFLSVGTGDLPKEEELQKNLPREHFPLNTLPPPELDNPLPPEDQPQDPAVE